MQPASLHGTGGEVFRRGGLAKNGAYWPWFFSTWLQAAEICGAVLLQAGEDHEVTLIDDVAAVALNVTVAGRLLFGRAAARRLGRRLGKGCRGRGNESEGQDKLADKLAHEILQRQEIRTSE